MNLSSVSWMWVSRPQWLCIGGQKLKLFFLFCFCLVYYLWLLKLFIICLSILEVDLLWTACTNPLLRVKWRTWTRYRLQILVDHQKIRGHHWEMCFERFHSTFYILLKILQITLQIWAYIPKTCQEVKLKAECSFCYGISLTSLWDYRDVRGQDAFPLQDEAVRFHRRQRAERLLPPVRDFHPVSYFHPKEVSLWSLIFSSMSSPLDSMGRGLSSFEENWLLLHVRITAHTSLATAVHPKI